jgi:hypothetical protein
MRDAAAQAIIAIVYTNVKTNNFFINDVSSIASIMKCFTVLAVDEAALIEKITQDACAAASR